MLYFHTTSNISVVPAFCAGGRGCKWPLLGGDAMRLAAFHFSLPKVPYGAMISPVEAII